MQLPKDLLVEGNYTKPDVFLCEVDKQFICKLEVTDLQASLKFNAYSELSFSVGRTYDNIITGTQEVNPYYHLIEALRLIYLEGFGYFEIQDPEIVSDGIQEVKNVTAYSLEYNLSQKYIENLYINTGEVSSREVMYAEANGLKIIEPVVLYNPQIPDLSLLHMVLGKVYGGWKIGHVDASLTKMSRMFEVSRASIYDFLTQDICEKFNCYFIFDTVENEINVYAESLITKFIGNGTKKTFILTNPYDILSSVSIDSYKTTAYTYNSITGELTFDTAPVNGAKIEVVDGSQEQWTTDVYITFENLAQEVNVSYSADDIKTVLTVKGADDLDIREVNFNLPYITDLSYYYSEEWMGKDLYDAYTLYLNKCDKQQDTYTENATTMIKINNRILYATTRITLLYKQADVDSTTVGTYYVRGGDEPNYYYTEVALPSEYNVNSTYYLIDTTGLNETKCQNLFAAIQQYYYSQNSKKIEDIEKVATDFAFVTEYTIANLVTDLKAASTTAAKDEAITRFIDQLWIHLGLMPLKEWYNEYNLRKITNESDGWNQESHEKYWFYHPVIVFLNSLSKAKDARQAEIDEYKQQYEEYQTINNTISNELLIANNFTSKQLIRLNAFLREDEYTDDNFVETDSDTIDSLMKTKQELLECGRIELSKLCEPKLAFSMDMANIYALSEFEPIIPQFQLGKLINVGIREDYIKRARLLQVDINFDDFSDFSCEFGELTNLRTPSSIHADLLANALSAGKSVASNASYWTKGSDVATSTDLKIQQGLLSAIDGLYSADQSVLINENGILLRRVLEDGSFSPHQAWLTSNSILLSDDSFETARVGLGEYETEEGISYGILTNTMLAGYIEGSTMVGGTINIGNGTFMVDSAGNVTMKASSIEGYVKDGNLISQINQSAEAITIDASKISLAGKDINLTADDITISSTNFSVTKDGKITASSGEIAGWTIYPNLFRKETTVDGMDYQIYMQATDGVSTSNAFVVRKKQSSETEWDYQFKVNYEGQLTAKNANITGTITAQGGKIAGYNIGSGGSYANALYKRVSGDSVDYEVGLKATNGDTDLAFYVKQSADSWASSENTFYIRNNGQLYARNADITGTINASSGNIGGCTISNGVLNISAANITSGTIASARIPNLSADKITAGTISVDRIPNINADKITTGTLSADRIPNISAGKITSGTISADRLSSSVITTGNFSSKTLSTGNLTMTSGARLGAASEYNAKIYSSGGYTWMEAFTSSSSYLSSMMNIVRAGVNVASSRDIKNEIHDFDNRYDIFFDKLNPQLFKYNFESDLGYSMGFIWEEAREAMRTSGLDDNDLGSLHESAGTVGGKVLRKDDFVALNTWQIQKLKTRIEELEQRLNALEA